MVNRRAIKMRAQNSIFYSVHFVALPLLASVNSHFRLLGRNIHSKSVHYISYIAISKNVTCQLKLTRVFSFNFFFFFFLQRKTTILYNFISVASILMILAFGLAWPYCSFNSKRYHGDRCIEFLLLGQKFYRPTAAI